MTGVPLPSHTDCPSPVTQTAPPQSHRLPLPSHTDCPSLAHGLPPGAHGLCSPSPPLPHALIAGGHFINGGALPYPQRTDAHTSGGWPLLDPNVAGSYPHFRFKEDPLCTIRMFDPPQTRQLLAGKRVLFIGDSHTRALFSALSNKMEVLARACPPAGPRAPPLPQSLRGTAQGPAGQCNGGGGGGAARDGAALHSATAVPCLPQRSPLPRGGGGAAGPGPCMRPPPSPPPGF